MEKWKQEVQKNFQEPTLSVKNYGGGDENVIGRLLVTLQVENKECQETILVQKGAKVDLLLGTDLISELGFLVLKALIVRTRCGSFEKKNFLQYINPYS